MLTLFAASCKKDQKAIDFTAEMQTIGDDSKVHMEGLYPTWDAADQVKINGNAYEVAMSGTGDSRVAIIQNVNVTSGSMYAFYPAGSFTSYDGTGNTVTFNLPMEQTYNTETVEGNTYQVVKMPMAAYIPSVESNRKLSFRNLCNLLKVTVTAGTGSTFTLNQIAVTAQNSGNLLNGSITTENLNSGTWDGCTPTGGTTTNYLTGIDESFTEGTVKTYYIVVPKLPNSCQYTVSLSTSQGSLNKTSTGSLNAMNCINKILGMSITATITEPITTSEITELSGAFSISSTKYVHFAKGNCKYVRGTDRASSSWKTFAEQYQFRKYLKPSGWATLSSTEDEVSYFSFAGYNTTTHYSATDAVSSTATYTEYGNAYGASGTWRCLTPTEWGNLLGTSAGTTGQKRTQTYRFAKVTVCGIQGLLLFPDGFSWNSDYGTAPTGGNLNTTNGGDFNVSYDLSHWQRLENAGCVFLPGAGYSSASAIASDSQWLGLYMQNKAGSPGQMFKFGTLNCGDGSHAVHKYSIRLCREYIR